MIGFIVAGIFIGILARLVLPGRQRIGIWMTIGRQPDAGLTF